jgi:hypothetical protein
VNDYVEAGYIAVLGGLGAYATSLLRRERTARRRVEGVGLSREHDGTANTGTEQPGTEQPGTEHQSTVPDGIARDGIGGEGSAPDGTTDARSRLDGALDR